MRYDLTRLVFEARHSVPLSEEEFTHIRTARNNLLEALGVEEKFNFVLENFEEFEGEMLRLTLGQALYQEFEWTTAVGAIRLLDRRLVNLLSTARLYLDHIRHTLKSIYGEGSAHCDRLTATTREQYGTRRGYRVMEAVRNYVQHRGLPIGGISYPGKWVEADGREFRRQRLVVRLDPDRLRADGKFKAAVLAELEGSKEARELKPLVRDYVTGISVIHEGFRQLTAGDVASWDALVLATIERYRAAGDSDVVGLYAVAREDREIRDQVALFADYIARRKWLERRNWTGDRKLDFVVSSD